MPIYQIFQNRSIKAATDRFAKQLQQHPGLGEAFAQALYKPVGWLAVGPGLDNKNLPTLLSSLPRQVGAFLIHYRQWVSKDSYLLVTTVDYFRPDESGHELFTRVRRGTRVTYNLNFVVRLDALKKQVVVLSDLYMTLVDKNLRSDFVQVIFKLLQLQLRRWGFLPTAGHSLWMLYLLTDRSHCSYKTGVGMIPIDCRIEAYTFAMPSVVYASIDARSNRR